MRQGDFDREIARLCNHFGSRHYSSELIGIFWKELGALPAALFSDLVTEAISVLPQGKAPLLDWFRAAAKESGSAPQSGWRYIEVEDCMSCGGCGWYWVKRRDGAEAVAACDDCRAGKNMQAAPKGHITITMKQIPGCIYFRPGKNK